MDELSKNQEALVRDLKTDLSEQIKTNIVDVMMLLQQASSITESDTSTIASDSINSITTSSTLATIMASVKSLEQELQQLKNNSGTTAPLDKSINSHTRKKLKHYCWTCDCYTHFSRLCPVKAPGHQDDASFANQKVGSNKDCRPNRE